MLKINSAIKYIYLFYIRIGYYLYGIEFVSNIVSKTHRHVIKDILVYYNAKVGNSVNFKDCILIDNAGGDQDATGDFSNLTIGNRCYVGKATFFDLPSRIILGDEVIVSAKVTFLTHSDCGNRMMSKYYSRKTGDIVIGDGSWIGANAIIFPGVKLGKCCVVGAGSVVIKSFPDYSVVVGVPAKLIKTLK
jgi:acetyltransferase-like isoleucine patch superfamily enzyme